MEGCEYCNQPEFCLWYGSVTTPCPCTCSRFDEPEDDGEEEE